VERRGKVNVIAIVTTKTKILTSIVSVVMQMASHRGEPLETTLLVET
jgi:hypothetical protein